MCESFFPVPNNILSFRVSQLQRLEKSEFPATNKIARDALMNLTQASQFVTYSEYGE